MKNEAVQTYSVWDYHKNFDTKNFNGCEWVVDGERGRETYPGDWSEKEATEAYRNGK